MIYTGLFVSGVNYSDYRVLQVSKSAGENRNVSAFVAELDSPYGRHRSDFDVGQDVKIYADESVLQNMSGSPFFQFKYNQSGASVVDSINGLIGSVNGATNGFSYTQGKIGSGIHLSGVTLINIFDLPDANVGTGSPFSICTWVNISGDSLGGAPSHGIIGRGNLTSCRWAIDTTSGTNHPVRFGFRSGVYSMICSPLPQIPKDTWHHVAGTYNGSNCLYQYIDGNMTGSFFTNGSGNNILPGSTVIGRTASINSNTGSQLEISVDDSRFYKSFLSADEINTIYNNGSGYEGTINDQFILRGVVDKVSFLGVGLDETVQIKGRDYGARLVDNTIEPTVYTNTEIGSIVRSLVTDNLTDIGSANVQNTSTNLPRISFNHIPLFDGIKQLSDYIGYTFYVDENKDLHFEPLGSSVPVVNLNSDNSPVVNFDKTREGMANRVWVYGDRYLAGFKEIVNVGSPNVGGNLGSVFTLQYSPYNTYVEKAGSALIGGVYGMTAVTPSGPQYLVNFFDKQIIFPSGTSTGYNLPVSGGSIFIQYDRDVPIVKFGTNRSSELAYGPKTLVINDKSIKDPQIAKDILNSKLKLSDPLRNMEVKVNGWYNIQPGETASLAFPNFSINEPSIPIIEANYLFTAMNNAAENVLTLRLDKREINIVDKIVEMKKRLDAIESADKSASDLFTRIEYDMSTVQVVGSHWDIKARWLGSEFRLWDSSNIPPIMSGGTVRLGILGSTTVGSTSYLVGTGFALQNYQTIRSGGYY